MLQLLYIEHMQSNERSIHCKTLVQDLSIIFRQILCNPVVVYVNYDAVLDQTDYTSTELSGIKEQRYQFYGFADQWIMAFVDLAWVVLVQRNHLNDNITDYLPPALKAYIRLKMSLLELNSVPLGLQKPLIWAFIIQICFVPASP